MKQRAFSATGAWPLAQAAKAALDGPILHEHAPPIPLAFNSHLPAQTCGGSRGGAVANEPAKRPA